VGHNGPTMTATQEGAGGAQVPAGIDREAHLERAPHSPWPRRLVITLIAVFCLLALLNTFGQVSAVTTADAPAASLRVDSPLRLRGGVIFTSVLTLYPHRKLDDAKLRLAPGWFDGMTLNAEAPQAQQESSDASGVTLDLGQLDAGATTPVWISWQTNPTTVGAREQDVTVFDGQQPILTVHRSVVVFP
jgi:hypothetical protein